MPAKGENAVPGKRIAFLDNLRTFMIFLVVVLHAGLVYEKGVFSTLFWIVYDPATNALVAELRIVMDIFIMSTIFFISGYLTPLSLRSKSGRQFLKGKFKRLMLPWLIAVLTLIPLYKLIYLYSRDLPQQHWTTYFHWSNEMWGQNWLWFLPVLFLFDLLYVLLSQSNIPLPKISLRQAVAAVFLVGFGYSVTMDAFELQGWTKTIVLDFQNERLLIYFMVFLLGAFCWKRRIFAAESDNKRLYRTVLCTVWLPILLYRFFYLNSVTQPGEPIFSGLLDSVLLWLSFHFSLLGLLYLLVHTFRVYLNKQEKSSDTLNQNSYQVYIIHVVVMGGLAMAMLNTPIPSLLKFIVLAVLTFAMSNLMVYSYRHFVKLKS